MEEIKKIKNIVIGAGPAGRLGSFELGKLGEETLVIEKKYIAGTCLNEGCMVVCALTDITIVLIFQALLLAHGGLTTLGANIFSMGIVGPFIAWLVYKGCLKANISSTIAIFFAAFLGDLLTYVATSFQLAFAFPAPTFGAALTAFLTIFAVTQVPLAIGEGILTVIIWDRLKAYKPKLLDKLGALAPNEA